MRHAGVRLVSSRALRGLLLASAAVGLFAPSFVRAQEEPDDPVDIVREFDGDRGISVPRPLLLARTPGALYVSAESWSMGREVWRITDRDAPVELVADLFPGLEGLSVGHYLGERPAERPRALGDHVWFRRAGELFHIDDTGVARRVLATGDELATAQPFAIGRVGDRTLLSAGTATHGTEPRVHRAGDRDASLLLDIAAGAASSDPAFVADLGGRLLLAITDDDHGRELWTSDGTAGGTALLRDLVPGEVGSHPTALLLVDGDLVFWARDADGATSLWRTDGTSDGTELLVDGSGTGLSEVAPSGVGIVDYDPAHPEAAALVDGAMVFAASDDAHGAELWRTDGTPQGTSLVADVVEGVTSSRPEIVGSLDGLVLFTAADAANRRRLWRTDGTSAGTERVSHIDARRFFTTANVAAGPDGLLFFIGDDGVNGSDLWRTDGTYEGTHMVADLVPGPDSPFDQTWIPNSPIYVGMGVGFDGAFWFDAGGVLFVTDGTAAGTKPAHAALDDSRYRTAIARAERIGARLYVGVYSPSVAGEELWATDRLTGELEKTLQPHGRTDDAGLSATDSAFADTLLTVTPQTVPSFFSRLWMVDDAGLELVTSFGHGPLQASFASVLHRSGSLAYLNAPDADGFGYSLWRTDGTASGTFALAEGRVTELVDAGGLTYAILRHSQYAFDIVSTDGTVTGTTVVSERELPPNVSPLTGLTAFDGALYFSSGEESGTELWVTDGTDAGTELFADLVEGDGSSSPGDLTPSGARLFFSVFDPVTRASALRVLDGNGVIAGVRDSAGTMIAPAELVDVGGTILFSAEDEEHGRELWTSDGTAAGTAMVRDIVAGPETSRVGRIVAVGGGRAVFTAATPARGVELWTTDGTESGTRRVTDIAPGVASSNPSLITVDGDRVVFAAENALGAVRLYAVDIADLATLPATPGDETPTPVVLAQRHDGPGAAPPPPVPPPEPPPPTPPEPEPEVLFVKKLHVRLPQRVEGRDTVTLVGSLPVPAGLDAEGAVVTVDVGGAEVSFVLGRQGKSVKRDDRHRFRINLRHRGRGADRAVREDPNARFVMKIAKSDLQHLFADEDLELSGSERSVDREIAVAVTWLEIDFAAVVPVRYTERRKIGHARTR